jgi:hypothetical protein
MRPRQARVGKFAKFIVRPRIDSWYDSLDWSSPRRKAATYTRQHKHRINTHIHPCLEIPVFERRRPRGYCDRQANYTRAIRDLTSGELLAKQAARKKLYKKIRTYLTQRSHRRN